MRLGILIAFLFFVSRAVAWADDEQARREQGRERDREAQNVEKKAVKLPLKLEKGKDYAFRVEMDAKQQGLQGSQGRQGQQGQGQQGSQGREGQQDQQGQRGSQSQGFGIQQTGTTQFTYRVKVKEASSNENTLEVAVDSPSQARGQNQSPLTVKVNQDGQVTQVEGIDELTGSRRSGQEGGQAAGSTAFTEGMVRSHLRLILGSGLHQSELRPSATLRPGQGSSAQQSGRGGQEGTPRPGIQPGSMDPLESIQLRYEGVARKGGEELAYFTVLPGDQSGTTPSSGRSGNIRPISAQEEGSREERRAGQGEGREGSLGNALYQVDDGLLQKVTVHGQFEPGSGQSGQSQSGQSGQTGGWRLWFQITRMSN